MSIYPFIGLARPMGRYKHIVDCALTPSESVKLIDLCCGLGFGKTLLLLQIAALVMDLDKNAIGLFFEPDWDRIESIFLPLWFKHVPSELYTHSVGKRKFTWHNGAVLRYRPRVITGSKSASRDKTRGKPTTFVMDDESAIGFDLEWYQNTAARIREKSDIRFFLTATTPKVGAYARFLSRGGNYVFRGTTRNNHYLLLRDPTYESRQRAGMSAVQARRELDGEIIALEGRIWCDFAYNPDKKDHSTSWPKGNRNDIHTTYDPNKPWWLLCDLGSATGAYVVVQQMEPVYRGHRQFEGSVWVAVADYCPNSDASAERAFRKMGDMYGAPAAISAGQDQSTRDTFSGKALGYFAAQVFGNVQILAAKEDSANKQIQFDVLSALIKNPTGRRFTIARDFVSHDNESKRGLREMVNEDEYLPMEERVDNEFLPKGAKHVLSHVRDACLMGCANIMKLPTWTRKT